MSSQSMIYCAAVVPALIFMIGATWCEAPSTVSIMEKAVAALALLMFLLPIFPYV